MGTRNLTVASPFVTGAGARMWTHRHRAIFHGRKSATSKGSSDRDFGRGTEFLHEVKIFPQFVWRIFTAALFSAVICVISPTAAKSEAAPDLSAFTITAPRVTSPPPIDGSIDHPAWRAAAHVVLNWNVDFRRSASDTTDAYVLADASYLYIAFAAHQSAPVLATQRTTGKAVDSDDWVAAFLWPGGVNGRKFTEKPADTPGRLARRTRATSRPSRRERPD